MNELQVFDFESNKIRTVMIDDEPYFVGKDVAKILGYAEPRSAVSKKVDDEDRGVAKIATPSGTQEMTVINESGVYSLVFGSKLPSAKKFKRWVTSEVLPTLRRTGSYRLPQTPEEKIQLLLEANQSANAKIEKVEERVSNLEDNRFLNPNEYGYLNTQISARVKEVKDVLHLECDRKQNSELFRAIGREIKQIAGVKCRSQLRYKDFEKVLDFIRTWEPSKATLYTIQQTSLEI